MPSCFAGLIVYPSIISSIREKGAKVDIEVQKDDNDDHQKRVLFNAAAVILNETPKGIKKFRDVPDVVVIFISKFDMFKKGKMFYKVDRILSGLGDVVYNGMSEYSSWKRTRNKKHQILTYAGLI